MLRPALRLLYQYDRARFALFRRRWASALRLGGPVSPNLRFARLRLGPDARLEIGGGFATERQRGNEIWLHEDGCLRLGERVWLRTQYGPNYLTVYSGARIDVGPDALINGVMLHAKTEITIGSHALLGFGVRILDADLHDTDRDTPERSEAVRIGDRVWIGADALVLRGVTIGDDVVVAAGSIVTRDLPDRCLAAGAPAQPIRALAPRHGCR